MERLRAIAEQFKPAGEIASIHELGDGIINDTYLVRVDRCDIEHFVLQRINTNVFKRPDLVMQNMRAFAEHARDRLQSRPFSRRWEVPDVLLTQARQDTWYCTEGFCWRAIGYIQAARTFNTVQSSAHAREIGFGLGTFQNLVHDLPLESLADTLEGFHITPHYLEGYDRVRAEALVVGSPEVDWCTAFIERYRRRVSVLEDAKAAGILQQRPIHGDPKVNNILFDAQTSQAVALIDLDTVKPGLIHYDVGDCLRSGCNPLGSGAKNWQDVRFELDLCCEILQGYFEAAGEFLTAADYRYLYDGIFLIAFELGLRFFSDYLAGNAYFKVSYPEQNLARSLVQFQLAASIEAQRSELERAIAALCRTFAARKVLV